MNKKTLLLALIITLTGCSVSSGNLPSFEDASERSINAVVHVKSEFLVRPRFYDDYFGFFEHFFGRPSQRGPQRVEGFGSGVVISPDGYIITNNHVIQGAESVHVTFNNRRTLPATIVGTDPSTDIALLKVDAQNLNYLTFGNSDEVRVGQWVLAVGNPFNLNSTVTAGIVSAKARNINILSRNMVMGGGGPPIESFIQTDAAVNRGNSGGALVNLYGELIGINTAIASTSGAFTGYSFAVPVNTARKVAEDLRTFGEVQRAFLGLLFAPMYQISNIEGHFNYIDGLRIERITQGGAVEVAGLQVGDIMMAIDGRPINTGGDFFEIIGQLRPGETIRLTYKRNGQTFHANILLQDIEGGTERRVVKEW
ncbi:MAG: trypsin-like peptidase domain-containing protein [Bacteroidales bacterium]|nr:trypsin-like peptidase domain-containing protein [Bacteroidales bacterium]